MWTPGFGEAGQRRLKDAAVLVSRVGGVGSVVAYELAAAGVGRLVLAHAGNVQPSDLNRQLLMTTGALGASRVQSAVRRLAELNPNVVLEAVPENISEENAAELVSRVDLVAGCAPLFEERLLMNREAVRQGKPLVDAAMYDMTAQVVTVLPGRTACLACLYPEIPPAWQREFPVFGAVSGAAACLAAVEAIKMLGGVGRPLDGRMVLMDLASMNIMTRQVRRRPGCPVCGEAARHSR
jgi:molybdopterin/thiamine biosynthesis adenylyltransferase